MVAVNENSLLIVECEDFFGFGTAGHRVTNRIFYVELDPEKTVDHCESLQDCDVPAPEKRLVWERNDDDKQLDGIAWGPMVSVDDSGGVVSTIALTFEDDNKIGVHFELYSLDIEERQNAPVWTEKNNKNALLKSRIIAGRQQHNHCR